MYKKIFFFFYLLCISLLHGENIPFTLEIAKTLEERSWGLMQRLSLPDDHGMLFYQPGGRIWMFNTFIDLSVAFLDEEGKIIEIAELKSYPEKMNPQRPVHNAKDLQKYPQYDDVYQFFMKKSYPVPSHAKYVLEMNKNWFFHYGIKPGDKVVWKENGNAANGYIMRENTGDRRQNSEE